MSGPASGSRRVSILDALHDELLVAIMCTPPTPPDSSLAVEDLLHLSRTCKRFRAIVTQECSSKWQRLYVDAFKRPMPQPSSGAAALAAYKERYIARNQELRLKRRLDRMQLHSEVQGCERDLRRVSMQLLDEEEQRRVMQEESASIRRAQQVKSVQATNAWVPLAIRQSWDMVASCAPVNPEWRLKQLANDLQASKLQTRVLQQQRTALQTKLRAAQKRLQFLEQG